MKGKRLLALLLAAIMLLAISACGQTSDTTTTTTADQNGGETTTTVDDPDGDETTEEPEEPIEVTSYSFLMCWNGGAASFPVGFDNGAVAKALEEKTGVRLEVETIASSEREKLAMTFAAGDLPDITNGPHWNTNPGGEGELIKNAAVEGLLLPLNGLYEDYPNVVRLMTEGMSDVYLSDHVEHPDYGGERYIIPVQTPRTENDVRNWAYNLFARKDILDDLGIAPEDVNTADAIYDLLVQIRNGGFVDINDRPVIPGGTWHNGWSYGEFLRSFVVGGVTGWDIIDGELVPDVFNPLTEERVLYMRKLVDEGLMDPECFTQTDTMGKEKMVTGRVAVHGTHYPHQFGFFQSTLYITNPEMEYVPLGPILNSKGEVVAQNERSGRNGSPAVFFSADIENPEKALAFIDYINSDEGLQLVTFGIEGTHFQMGSGGIPVLTEEWATIKAEDSVKWNSEGFGIGGQFIGADPRIGWGWDPEYEQEGYVRAREINPINFYQGLNVDDIGNQWPGRAAYDQRMATVNWGDELKKAFLASSDDEALRIIQAQRDRMESAGIADMIEFIEERMAEDSSIVY